MPCPVPSHLPTPPTLTTLLDELAAVNAPRATELQASVHGMEGRQREAREQLAAAESVLSLVKPGSSGRTLDEWCLRFADAQSARHAVRRLAVDADSLRAVLERELFLARRSRALGRVICPSCVGSGDGPPLDGGTSLVLSSCDTCAGTGYVRSSRPAR
ncbi:hypothetical protein [Archangium lansingense]|uniref:Uncharacterized protein n=1 Tax=Archangium lansingense TaxID=2995310 RepID=A0ABT4AF14_9BACT|nr:hypothetical protein [Archangium lansinium]MCY1080280.1 hypothetical protein [Archangium lansinium]